MQHENSKAKLFLNFSIEQLVDLIDWNYFFGQWNIGGRFPEIFNHPQRGIEAKKLYDDAIEMLNSLDVSINAAYKTFKTRQLGDDIMLSSCDCCNAEVRLPMLRNQTTHFKSLSDYVTEDYNQITLFALCVHNNTKTTSDYDHIMSEILCNRLADAMQTLIQNEVQEKIGVKSLTFAFGYPATPDHSPKKLVFDLLSAQKNLNMTITENYAMLPLSSCCGVIVSHPKIEYFSIGYIGEDQIVDYAQRAGLTIEQLKSIIPNNIL